MQTDLTGFAAATGGANRLLAALPTSAGWLLETVLTFSLIFIIFIATDNRRAQSTAHLPMLAPAAIGFTVFACHLAAVALDGCSINPARSFGPAVTSGEAPAGSWKCWLYCNRAPSHSVTSLASTEAAGPGPGLLRSNLPTTILLSSTCPGGVWQDVLNQGCGCRTLDQALGVLGWPHVGRSHCCPDLRAHLQALTRAGECLLASDIMVACQRCIPLACMAPCAQHMSK